jgi:hypothetical protein
LTGVRNRFDRAERSLRLLHAHAVIRLDALQIEFHQLLGRDLFGENGLLNLRDGRLLQMKLFRCGSRRRERHERNQTRRQTHGGAEPPLEEPRFERRSTDLLRHHVFPGLSRANTAQAFALLTRWLDGLKRD